jgi:hypothetical protein
MMLMISDCIYLKVFHVAATKAAFAGLEKLAMTDLEWMWLENFLDILAVSHFCYC